ERVPICTGGSSVACGWLSHWTVRCHKDNGALKVKLGKHGGSENQMIVDEAAREIGIGFKGTSIAAEIPPKFKGFTGKVYQRLPEPTLALNMIGRNTKRLQRRQALNLFPADVHLDPSQLFCALHKSRHSFHPLPADNIDLMFGDDGMSLRECLPERDEPGRGDRVVGSN
ncbi:hypothetical protein JX266_014333, partial [Neoarthrinium moseri]